METVAQLILYVCILFLFGENFFLHELMMLLNTGFNFAVLPAFYILADQEVKTALANKDFKLLLRSFTS